MLSHRLNVFDVVLVKGCSIQSHHGLYARSTSYCSKQDTTQELWSASTHKVSKYTPLQTSAGLSFESWFLESLCSVCWALVLVGWAWRPNLFTAFQDLYLPLQQAAPSASALKIVVATCNPVSGPVVPPQIYSPCCGSILAAVSCFLSNMCISRLFYPCCAYFFLNDVTMHKRVITFLLFLFSSQHNPSKNQQMVSFLLLCLFSSQHNPPANKPVVLFLLLCLLFSSLSFYSCSCTNFLNSISIFKPVVPFQLN